MGAILTASATMMCPHGGPISAIVSDAKRAAARAPILTASDTFMVAGCAFAPGGVPHPCVSVRWITGSTKTTAHGAAVLCVDSVGLCVAADQAPQGPPVLIPAQTQAVAL